MGVTFIHRNPDTSNNFSDTAPDGHPYMLFHDISEIPGYQYRTIDPWKTWERNILLVANKSLARDFSGNLGSYDRIGYRADFARDLGLAYQITKKTGICRKSQRSTSKY